MNYLNCWLILSYVHIFCYNLTIPTGGTTICHPHLSLLRSLITEIHFITNTFGFQVLYKNTTASAQLLKNLTILTYYLNVAKL